MTHLRCWINLWSVPFRFILQIDVELLVGDCRLFQSQFCLMAVPISPAAIRLDSECDPKVHEIDAHPVGEWADLRRVQRKLLDLLDHFQACAVTQSTRGGQGSTCR